MQSTRNNKGKEDFPSGRKVPSSRENRILDFLFFFCLYILSFYCSIFIPSYLLLELFFACSSRHTINAVRAARFAILEPLLHLEASMPSFR